MKKLMIILGMGLLVRLLLAPYGTLELDQNTFIAWSHRLREVGFGRFYDTWSDYLPGYLYILWGLSAIPLGGNIVVLYKLPAILADVATSFVIYRVAWAFGKGADLKREKVALIAVALYLFNPAVFGNSTLWGQVDGFTALFGLMAVWLFGRHFYLSAVALAVGALIKPQAAVAAIPIVYLFFERSKSLRESASYVIVSGSLFLLAFVPFWTEGNLLQFVFSRVGQTLGQYPYTSVNAFNLWGIFGFWKPDTQGVISQKLIGYVVFVLIALVSFVKLKRVKNGEYILLGVVFIANFLFFTRMHERHLLPALAPLSILAVGSPVAAFAMVGLSLVYVLNLAYSYNFIVNDFGRLFSPLLTSAISAFAVTVFLLFFAGQIFEKKIKIARRKPYQIRGDIFGGKWKVALFLVFTFALLGRLLFLSEPQGEYFDEVYHAFTAQLVAEGDPKAWEWWNPNPEGFAYEWTHPPLAKLGMAIGIGVLGESAFAWRLPGALLGVGGIYLVYKIGKELFGSRDVGILAAAIFSLDGLYLVMSRIGMNDVYFLFFGLLGFYMFLGKRYFWSAVGFGLSIASKWSALWLLPILGFIFLIERRKLSFSLLWFLIMPAFVYVASYWQLFSTGHAFSIFWGVQKQMWWYHTGLVATHPYTSDWWSWPLMMRPIYLYTSGVVAGRVSNIYATGNPAVFWFGFLSVLAVTYWAVVERSKAMAIVAFSYFAFFVPWMASPRIMFLYHYLPSMPFLALASAYVLRRFVRISYLYFLVAILLFVYFYPHWAGINIPVWLDNSYYWFSDWR